jgi:putative membrane protein
MVLGHGGTSQNRNPPGASDVPDRYNWTQYCDLCATGLTIVLFAFLHHVAAFTLVAAVAVELVLLRGALTLWSARRLQVAELVLGIAAGVLLVVGLAGAVWFETGAADYFANHAFLTKLTLFIVVGLRSIVPTIEFLSWRWGGQAPAVAAGSSSACG